MLPARDSVTMVTKELAVRLRAHADVALYGSGGSRRASGIVVDGLEHVLVPTGPDRALHRVASATRRRLRPGGEQPRRPFFESGLSYLPYAVRVAMQLRRRRTEIVHIQSFSHFVPVIRAFNPRAKVVLHMHCEWLSQLDPAMIGPRLRRTDLVVSCSDHVTERVRSAFGRSVRCVTVHNGIGPATAPAPRPETGAPALARRLLFVSRVSPEKGVHVLLDAFSLVAQEHPDVVLDIAGPEHTIPAAYIVDIAAEPEVAGLHAFYGGDRYGDQLRRRIPTGLRERVSFLGFVPPAELAGLYRSATLLVHPTLSDSFGMPVVEAMAAGLPVVASRIGGIPEVVDDGTTGVLVPANDPEALARAVLALLADEDRAAAMGRAGRERALARFTWDRAATTLWSEYERLLAQPPRRRAA